MSEGRKFVNPEGSELQGIEFVRAKALFEQLEESGEGSIVAAEGTFLEEVPNTLDGDKMDFKLEDEDGRTIIVNNSGNLGYRMKSISAGDYVQIRYEGKQPIKNGKFAGKLSHQFSVLVAE
jgi:hypothetical protein